MTTLDKSKAVTGLDCLELLGWEVGGSLGQKDYVEKEIDIFPKFSFVG